MRKVSTSNLITAAMEHDCDITVEKLESLSEFKITMTMEELSRVMAKASHEGKGDRVRKVWNRAVELSQSDNL